MRIALVNNNNNILFCIARHLRDRGHDVTLCMMDYEYVDAPHFHPSCDTFDLDYQSYSRVLEWGLGKAFSTYDFNKVRADLAPFDYVIGTGSTPAFMAKIGRPLDMFIPWGADIWEAPFNFPPFNRRSLRSLVEFPYWQRRGIIDTKVVFADLSPIFDPALERLNYKGKRVVAQAPMPYGPLFKPGGLVQYEDRTAWFPIVRKLRDRTDVLVHAPSRHVWKTTLKYNWTKGTDRIIHGVAEAKKRGNGKKFGLVFYEYGPDVNASRELVDELGLTDDVLWLPLSTRKEVMVNLSVCDFSIGEVGDTSWYTGGTVLEALAMGKPLLHRRDDHLYVDAYEELYPMIHVRGAKEITDALLAFADDPAPFRALGDRARVWFDEHVSRKSLDALEAELPRPRART
jgi:hypothetical protein